MKAMIKFTSLALCLVMCLSALALTSCDDDDTPEGAVSINFWYDCGLATQSVYRELIQKYNETQGVEDGVYVVGSKKTGIATSARTQITGGNPPSVIMISDTVFRAYARDGLFLDLTSYFTNDAGSYNESNIPDNMTDRFKITVNVNGGKTYIGDGEAVLGIPFASDPSVLYYNVDYFKQQGINIISVPEDELDAYNREHGTNFAPHGYAEYSVGYLTGDASSFAASKSLSGKQVVKVFNNCVPMNWEELRNLSKYFTKEYNSASPTDRGFATEWWFSHGWSVGGDCIGYDGNKYNFTLADDSDNYLVTAANGITVNGNKYSAGETIKYEDKVNDSNIDKYVSEGSLYKLPSQKDALVEFLRLTGDTSSEIDSGLMGYGVTYPDTNTRTEGFTSGKVAIVVNSFSVFMGFENALGESVDMAVMYQYREYEGGSTYTDGGNEYLKVIGETNPGDSSVYTGKLATENGTEIVGNLTTSDGVEALVIPKNSDPEKYEAAWKFIRWASSEEAQKILAGAGNIVPVENSAAASDEFYSLNTSKNYFAASFMSRLSDVGDWGYFEDGQWITDWANDFNQKLRYGKQTLSEFLAANASKAQKACEDTSIIIKGWK